MSGECSHVSEDGRQRKKWALKGVDLRRRSLRQALQDRVRREERPPQCAGRRV